MTQSSHAQLTGDRAHRIVASLSESGLLPLGRLERATTILDAGRQVMANHPAKVRPRAVLVSACAAAASYFHHFSLDENWIFIGSEFSVPDGRVDLLFRHKKGQYLIDELKFGLGRDKMVSVHQQVDRYLASGKKLWGNHFKGVRMCAVAEPLESRLYLPEKPRFLRLDTPLAIKLQNLDG